MKIIEFLRFPPEEDSKHREFRGKSLNGHQAFYVRDKRKSPSMSCFDGRCPDLMLRWGFRYLGGFTSPFLCGGMLWSTHLKCVSLNLAKVIEQSMGNEAFWWPLTAAQTNIWRLRVSNQNHVNDNTKKKEWSLLLVLNEGNASVSLLKSCSIDPFWVLIEKNGEKPKLVKWYPPFSSEKHPFVSLSPSALASTSQVDADCFLSFTKPFNFTGIRFVRKSTARLSIGFSFFLVEWGGVGGGGHMPLAKI